MRLSHLLPQVKSGTIFDNVLICDDEEYAATFGEETWGATKGPEKEMKDAVSREFLLHNHPFLLHNARNTINSALLFASYIPTVFPPLPPPCLL